MDTIVQKYGGTSIGTPDKMNEIIKIINEQEFCQTYVVVSAISSRDKKNGTTNLLLKCIYNTNMRKEIIMKIREHHITFAKYIQNDNLEQYINNTCKEIMKFLDDESYSTIKKYNLIISKGEEMSAKILTEFLKYENINCDVEYIDLSTINLLNNIDDIIIEIRNKLSYQKNVKKNKIFVKKNKIFVIGGYINNCIEMIGRGYSDYTAGLIARAMDVKELQIWKEVDGIFSADPNLIDDAKLLKTISKDEIYHLTYYGCQAINSLTIDIVKCPIVIKNCNKSRENGTIIVEKNEIKSTIPTAVTIKENINIINIKSYSLNILPDFFIKVFKILGEHNVVVDLVCTSHIDISIAIDITQNYNEELLLKELINIGKVNITHNLCILSIIGANMIKSVGIASKIFNILSTNNINIEMISQGASEINISCIINKNCALEALRHIHNNLII